jgi:hypothetical protein
MTKEEKQQKENLAEIRKSTEEQFKREAMFKALNLASTHYSGGGAKSLTEEAEKIYQWLIKY